MTFYDQVYEVVKTIPIGKVATYGQIAHLCGSPCAARAVGNALHVNPMPLVIPCHRVVNSYGGLAPFFAFGGKDRQKKLLEEENVSVDDNYAVDLKKYQWTFI
jgi:methylated-DNA-protein-cysteine methyltransferase related protein